MINEIWKPVLNYEDLYLISNLGNIKSLDRKTTHQGRWIKTTTFFQGKPLRVAKTKGGYCYVSLSKDGKGKKHLLHRLVLQSFIGNNENQVNHKDGNKQNNNLENLEYCTAQENLLHCTKILKKKIGSLNGHAKLKESDILKIKSDTRTLKEIAKDYGVTLQAIHHVKKGKNWTHVNDLL